MMPKVAIIDSGGANIASLLFALERLGTSAVLTTDAEVIRTAERVVLPGVGAAKDAMSRLAETGLIDVIRTLTQPVLGICLGMQLLCDASEEEDVECLGIIPGTARKLPAMINYPVPNMGWCSTRMTKEHKTLADIENGSYFYYLHSYAVPVSKNTLAIASHADEFAAVIAYQNFIAAQFHPERSSSAGAKLLQNFIGTPQ
jgi:glutamine amidotransferase